MKLQDIKKKLKKYPYVTDAFFYNKDISQKTIKNQLVEWVKDGEILRLRKKFYTLNDDDRGAGLSKKLTANVIYYPSYLSLEYALSYYDMIPEAIFSVTSVTPRKTQVFVNHFGEFIYKSIKNNFFFGYILVKDEFGYEILIATPEKALLDFFYFYTRSNTKIEDSYFEESLRLQNVEIIDDRKMEQFAQKINSKKLNNITDSFIKWKETL